MEVKPANEMTFVFAILKCRKNTVMLSVNFKNSMRDLICDNDYCR